MADSTPEPFVVVTGAPACDDEYVFAFEVKRTEADIEAAFLAKGGSLGGAAARAETDFALTHSERATSALVTETIRTIELPISKDMLNMVPRETRAQIANGVQERAGGPTIVLSSRARLNMTAARVAASINGTLVGTMSGQGSIALKDLFEDVVPLSNLLDANQLSPDELMALQNMLGQDKENAAPATGSMADTLRFEKIQEDLKELARRSRPLRRTQLTHRARTVRRIGAGRRDARHAQGDRQGAL